MIHTVLDNHAIISEKLSKIVESNFLFKIITDKKYYFRQFNEPKRQKGNNKSKWEN